MGLKLLSFCVLGLLSSTVMAKTDKPEDVLDLNIEDLVNVNVTSVSKKSQALSDAPAAIFVISQEDIKRSGVTAIPEALRLAPGLDVARLSANQWAISARGFNGTFATKLLVLIDGRSVYSPAFSGVYWDSQDVVMDDIERIEVIRGPGATLWGANAVNGVVNIITKKAEDTQNGQLVAGAGSVESGFASLRYGKKLGEDTFARAYVKGFQREGFKTTIGMDAGDDWQKQQGGFRIDSRLNAQDEFTLQGDLYQGRANQLIAVPLLGSPYTSNLLDTQKISGWNITSKFQHAISSTAAYKLQFYYDRYNRDEYQSNEIRDTVDLDFQHNFQLTERQNAIWGLDYRLTMDHYANGPSLTFNTASRGVQLFSGFLQDEIMLLDEKLWFTLGSKFEHNDYTGFEGQPTAKLMWAPAAHHRFWASVSRAVRTPSRAERDVNIFAASLPPSAASYNIPVSATVAGNPQFRSEVQIAYELGYRFTMSKALSVDLTAFYSDYSRLRAGQMIDLSVVGTYPNLSLQQSLQLANNLKANTHGVEIASVWQMLDWWRWDANYSFLGTDYSTGNALQNVSPAHKVSVRAALSPLKNTNFDVWLRYNDSATALTAKDLYSKTINSYVTLDMRLAWSPIKSLEFSVTGQNLLEDYHLEYIDELYLVPTEIPRGVYGKVSWQF